MNKNYANNISSFSDLAQQTDIKYGFLNESSTHNLFRESTDPTIAQLYRTMSESSDAFLPTLREGIRRAKETSTGFAFFTEGMVAEYIVGQNCETHYYFGSELSVSPTIRHRFTQKLDLYSRIQFSDQSIED